MMRGVVERFNVDEFSGWVKSDGEELTSLNIGVEINGYDVHVEIKFSPRVDIGDQGLGFICKFINPLASYPKGGVQNSVFGRMCAHNPLIFKEATTRLLSFEHHS